MSLLYDVLRVHQVFGANTNVGKTILTTALVRASAATKKRVFYLKPVSTGPKEDADDEHVKRHAGHASELVHAHCLYNFQEAVSPHLAARLACRNRGDQVQVPSDERLVGSISDFVQICASRATKAGGHMYIETAGGVHSPTSSGTTQVDAYRPLFLPTILIGDAHLGGISSTISSYESLLLRGYIVDTVLLFRDEYYRNWEYLTSYFAERGIHVAAFTPPPSRVADAKENVAKTEDYYRTIVPSDCTGTIFDTIRHLDGCHGRRLEQLDSMPRRTLDTIWWPFVQHGLVGEKDVTVIDSAFSDFFSVYRQNASPNRGRDPETGTKSSLRLQFDGSASWWTQALGHAHPSLVAAAARGAGRYGHVIFPQATHLPALELAERLLQDGPGKGWASRVFFSDDGSTGMEVALKMALRAYTARHGEELDSAGVKQLGVLGLKGSYHGDTIGAMDACEEGVFSCEWHNAKGYWFEPPTLSIQRGQVTLSLPTAIASESDDQAIGVKSISLSDAYDVTKRLKTTLADTYRNYIRRTLDNLRKRRVPPLAALVLEPLVLGAGGMIFVDPLFQRVLVDVVRNHPSESTHTGWSGMPVIFDEVFVGLYRIGMQSPAACLGVNPDISVYAKILTGGVLPLAVTLASDSIFRAFLSQKKTDALLHGHSYTAHPIGCEVANETLKILKDLSTSDPWREAQAIWTQTTGVTPSTVWSFWDPKFVKDLSYLDKVAEVMALGTVLAFRVKDKNGGYGSQSAKTLLQSIETISNLESNLPPGPAATPFGIHFRTLGDVAYFMTSLNTSPTTIRTVEAHLIKALQ